MSETNEILSVAQQELFQRLNNYVTLAGIELEQLWKNVHVCLTVEQFQQMLGNINFHITKQEKNMLNYEGVQFITLENIIIGVSEFNKVYKDIGQFISKRGNNSQQKTKVVKVINNKEIGIQNQSSSQMQKQYMKIHKKRQQQRNYLLNNTINRTQNESDYQITIKVGEINDICKKLKNQLSYSINSSTIIAGLEIIEKNGKTNVEKKITKNQFNKLYVGYKQAKMNMVETIQGNLQEDLKKVLVEVMFMSSQLQKQISLLQQKGITP